MIDSVGQERTLKYIGSYRSSLPVSSVCSLLVVYHRTAIVDALETDRQVSEHSSYSKLFSPTYPIHIPRNWHRYLH
jgi:hypothetical protein